MLLDITRLQLALFGAAAYLVLRSIYRLYFHPLRKIPGPKLSILTELYEFYYDVICGGKFLLQIEKMHKKYGPIVRINAREVHINDPSFVDEIYASGARRREKDPKWVPAFGLYVSTICTIDHDLHRARRGVMSNFFSKKTVLEMCPMVEAPVKELIKRFEGFHESKQIVQLDNAFSAMTSDMITTVCYGKSGEFLKDENFCTDIRSGIADATKLSHINRFFPFITPALRSVPPQVMKTLLPGKSALFDFQKSIADQAAQTFAGGDSKGSRRVTIYDKLTDPSLPPEERTLARIEEDSFLVLGAGTETTTGILTIAAYHIYQNKDILERLRAELKQVLPQPSSTSTWTELEKLPYFTAVIRESLRLGYGIPARLPRVAPNEVLNYKGYEIAPGTPMSTAAYIVHRDPTIFPNPDKFDPERFLHPDGTPNDKLARNLMAFGKGSRGCLGINLAYSELYLTLAYVVRKLTFEICDTTDEDVAMTSDYIVVGTRRGELKVYAKVTEVLQE